jgi:hypothetical protein
LLLDCGVFCCINQQKAIFYQLSGMFALNHQIERLTDDCFRNSSLRA